MITYSKWMTDEEIDATRKLVDKVNTASEYLGVFKAEWADAETAYLGEQTEKDGVPNTRVNVILANIEGQAGELATQELSVVCMGQSENDQQFARDAQINLEWDLRHQEDLFGMEMDAARRFLKYGGVWFKNHYDPFAFDGFGVPRIDCPSLDRVVVDPKCVSPRRLQDAEWIAEFISMSRAEAEAWYGKKKAEDIIYGQVDETYFVFKTDTLATSDDNAWTLIQVWSKDEGKLRLREYAHCGLLLHDSFKGEDRKENQKSNKVSPNSYYTHVCDRYPYVFRALYPREGKLYGIGDAKLIVKLQNLLNNLYDMIRIGSRPNIITVDSAANIDLEALNNDSFAPVYFDSTELGVNNRDPIRSVPWAQVNENWWRLVAAIHAEIERVLRYSSLMMGNRSTASTATEAAIQQQQGNRATNTKQKVIESALEECVSYMFGLDLQFRSGKKSMRLNDDKPEFHEIDYDAFKNIPQMAPVEAGVEKMYRENGNTPPPKQILMKKGKPVTKSIALDMKVNIGAGLPKNPSFLVDFSNKLATTLMYDENGQPRPAMTVTEFRKFARDVMGFPLDDDEKSPVLPQMAMTNRGATESIGGPGMNMSNPMDANSPLAAGGGVPLAPLNAIKRGQA